MLFMLLLCCGCSNFELDLQTKCIDITPPSLPTCNDITCPTSECGEYTCVENTSTGATCELTVTNENKACGDPCSPSICQSGTCQRTEEEALSDGSRCVESLENTCSTGWCIEGTCNIGPSSATDFYFGLPPCAIDTDECVALNAASDCLDITCVDYTVTTTIGEGTYYGYNTTTTDEYGCVRTPATDPPLDVTCCDINEECVSNDDNALDCKVPTCNSKTDTCEEGNAMPGADCKKNNEDGCCDDDGTCHSKSDPKGDVCPYVSGSSSDSCYCYIVDTWALDGYFIYKNLTYLFFFQWQCVSNDNWNIPPDVTYRVGQLNTYYTDENLGGAAMNPIQLTFESNILDVKQASTLKYAAIVYDDAFCTGNIIATANNPHLASKYLGSSNLIEFQDTTIDDTDPSYPVISIGAFPRTFKNPFYNQNYDCLVDEKKSKCGQLLVCVEFQVLDECNRKHDFVDVQIDVVFDLLEECTDTGLCGEVYFQRDNVVKDTTQVDFGELECYPCNGTVAAGASFPSIPIRQGGAVDMCLDLKPNIDGVCIHNIERQRLALVVTRPNGATIEYPIISKNANGKLYLIDYPSISGKENPDYEPRPGFYEYENTWKNALTQFINENGKYIIAHYLQPHIDLLFRFSHNKKIIFSIYKLHICRCHGQCSHAGRGISRT